MQLVDSEKSSRLSLGEEKNMVTQLLLINITVFIFLFFTWVIFRIENYTDQDFNSSLFDKIVFQSDPEQLIWHPWTIITAMFTHIGVFQAFSNFLWLWFFGSTVQHAVGHQKIVPMYVFAGWAGYLVFMLGFFGLQLGGLRATGLNVFGAWAPVTAFAVASIMLAPKHRIFTSLKGGGIPVWLIGLLYFVLVIAANYNVNGNHHYEIYFYIAGGAIMGAIYAAQLKKGRDIGAWLDKLLFNIGHLFHPKEQRVRQEYTSTQYLAKERVFYKQDTVPYQKVGTVSENKLNEILDKINETGMESLTEEEKLTLERASKSKE